MNKHYTWIAPTVLCCFGILCSQGYHADNWTTPVELTHNQARCISFRARLAGPYLVVEGTPAPGWHTFAMDNARRAAEKLAGKKALSQDMPTQISVTGALTVDGPWFQSPPKDFSRPKLRWYSWGFDDRALFVAGVRRSGGSDGLIGIQGQVCTSQICKRIDLQITLPLGAAESSPEASLPDFGSLIQVR